MLVDLERVLVCALSDDQPWEALQREATALSSDDRTLVARIDHDGFVLTSLLVRKLRFERLMNGDAGVARWFREDARGFTEAFRAYNAQVPPRFLFPADEAHAFRAWCAPRGLPPDPERGPIDR
jgi:hypothetical protein